MSEPWEIFQRAWEHGFNIGYLQGYIPFIFILNRYPYIDDLYRKNIFNYSGSDLCTALYFQAVCNLCKDRKEIDEYFENLKREREAAQKKEEQTRTEP